MWDESTERLLQKYCDESQVRQSLHRHAYYRYKRLTTCMQLPVIILSALAGSAAFLSKGYPEWETGIVTATASTSILVSIVSAVATYLKLWENKSRHETSQVAWQNFFNSVKHELSLRRDLRQDPADFLKTVKCSYDRLFEISPICSRDLIKHVKKRVRINASPNFQVPVYLNGFTHTPVYRDEDDDYEDNQSE